MGKINIRWFIHLRHSPVKPQLGWTLIISHWKLKRPLPKRLLTANVQTLRGMGQRTVSLLLIKPTESWRDVICRGLIGGLCQQARRCASKLWMRISRLWKTHSSASCRISNFDRFWWICLKFGTCVDRNVDLKSVLGEVVLNAHAVFPQCSREHALWYLNLALSLMCTSWG